MRCCPACFQEVAFDPNCPRCGTPVRERVQIHLPNSYEKAVMAAKTVAARNNTIGCVIRTHDEKNPYDAVAWSPDLPLERIIGLCTPDSIHFSPGGARTC